MKIKHIFYGAYILISLYCLWYILFIPFVGTFQAGSKYEIELVIELWVVAINLINLCVLLMVALKNWNKSIFN